MALDDDMTTPPEEPDSRTPADRAAGSISEDDPTIETEEDTGFA